MNQRFLDGRGRRSRWQFRTMESECEFLTLVNKVQSVGLKVGMNLRCRFSS